MGNNEMVSWNEETESVQGFESVNPKNSSWNPWFNETYILEISN